MRIAAGILVAVAVGVAVWLIVRGNNARTTHPPTPHALLSDLGLTRLAGALANPIYWEGPVQPGGAYELKQTQGSRIILTYLPPGAKTAAGHRYPFVVTLPVQNAFATTKALANRPGSIKVLDGTVAVASYSRSSPTNIYLAFRGLPYQIEVFDPDPARARQLVAQGKIAPVPPIQVGPVGGSAKPVQASVALLSALPAKLHHPVYWAGPEPRVKYELTQTSNGEVFIRYLPFAARIGTATRYPFVGTLPLKNAFSATTVVARRRGSVRMVVAGRAVAFYGRSLPTNVYLAFRGSAFQVQVFAPDSKQARKLAARIRPIP